MILILTNKDDVTVDFIVRELQEKKFDYFRLNTEDIPEKIDITFKTADDSFIIYDKNKQRGINLDEVSAVYYRRPEISKLDYIHDISEEERMYLRSELYYLLEGIYKLLRNKQWLNNVYKIREAENKIYQLEVAKKIGFDIPDSLCSNRIEAVKSMIETSKGDCIIKPIKSGNMQKRSKSEVIFTSPVNDYILQNRERITSFPVYLQKNIHKKFDLRCIVVGEEVFCAQIDSQKDDKAIIDWRASEKYLTHEVHELPLNIKNKCIAITKKFGLNYSAIDLILDKNGNYIFLECNPNGQWAWLENRLGFPISTAIVTILQKGIKNEDS